MTHRWLNRTDPDDRMMPEKADIEAPITSPRMLMLIGRSDGLRMAAEALMSIQPANRTPAVEEALMAIATDGEMSDLEAADLAQELARAILIEHGHPPDKRVGIDVSAPGAPTIRLFFMQEP